MKHYIYIYSDPRDGTPLYVGKGTGRRATAHLNNAENPGLAAAIAELRALGLEPTVAITEYFATEAEVCAREVELIAHYGRRAWSEGPLFNIAEGGDGFNEEWLRRLWADPKYRKRNLEHLNRLNTDPEIQRRRTESFCRRINDPEYLARHTQIISNSKAAKEALRHVNANTTSEQRAERARLLWTDPGYRASCLESYHTPEYRAKQSENSKRSWADPERRARQSEKTNRRLKK